jgi:hypothetical protein
MSTENSDVLQRKAEAEEMLIVYRAEPLSYTTLCRIVFGPYQSADEAGFAFRILGASGGSWLRAFCYHGESICCLTGPDTIVSLALPGRAEGGAGMLPFRADLIGSAVRDSGGARGRELRISHSRTSLRDHRFNDSELSSNSEDVCVGIKSGRSRSWISAPRQGYLACGLTYVSGEFRR